MDPFIILVTFLDTLVFHTSTLPTAYSLHRCTSPTQQYVSYLFDLQHFQRLQPFGTSNTIAILNRWLSLIYHGYSWDKKQVLC